jgi:hypothetical protein
LLEQRPARRLQQRARITPATSAPRSLPPGSAHRCTPCACREP